MSLEDYVNHIKEKYKLIIAISVLKTKPVTLSIEDYINILRAKIEQEINSNLVSNDDFIIEGEDNLNNTQISNKDMQKNPEDMKTYNDIQKDNDKEKYTTQAQAAHIVTEAIFPKLKTFDYISNDIVKKRETYVQNYDNDAQDYNLRHINLLDNNFSQSYHNETREEHTIRNNSVGSFEKTQEYNTKSDKDILNTNDTSNIAPNLDIDTQNNNYSEKQKTDHNENVDDMSIDVSTPETRDNLTQMSNDSINLLEGYNTNDIWNQNINKHSQEEVFDILRESEDKLFDQSQVKHTLNTINQTICETQYELDVENMVPPILINKTGALKPIKTIDSQETEIYTVPSFTQLDSYITQSQVQNICIPQKYIYGNKNIDYSKRGANNTTVNGNVANDDDMSKKNQNYSKKTSNIHKDTKRTQIRNCNDVSGIAKVKNEDKSNTEKKFECKIETGKLSHNEKVIQLNDTNPSNIISVILYRENDKIINKPIKLNLHTSITNKLNTGEPEVKNALILNSPIFEQSKITHNEDKNNITGDIKSLKNNYDIFPPSQYIFNNTPITQNEKQSDFGNNRLLDDVLDITEQNFTISNLKRRDSMDVITSEDVVTNTQENINIGSRNVNIPVITHDDIDIKMNVNESRNDFSIYTLNTNGMSNTDSQKEYNISNIKLKNTNNITNDFNIPNDKHINTDSKMKCFNEPRNDCSMNTQININKVTNITSKNDFDTNVTEDNNFNIANIDTDVTDFENMDISGDECAEVVPYKIIKELNKIKSYLNRKDGRPSRDGYSTDSGYKCDTQYSRSSLSASQQTPSFNQSGHSLFNYLLCCPLLPQSLDIVNEIALILGKLLDKLHEDENYPSFLEELLDTVKIFLKSLHQEDDEENSLLNKEETSQRILLLNKSPHIQKYTIEQITNILQETHTILINKDAKDEIKNINSIENTCYIFNILLKILKKYIKYKKNPTKNSQEETILRRSSLTDLWRKKWDSNMTIKTVEIEVKSCILDKMRVVLNMLIVDCMERYSLIVYYALECYNLLQTQR